MTDSLPQGKIEDRHAGGRPLKYQTVQELEKAIKRYFKSCEDRWVFKQDWVMKGNSKGKIVYDRNGQPTWIKAKVRVHKSASVPDKTGLAVALGVSRRTLNNYSDRPEFVLTMERAYALCEAASAAQLYGSSTRGAIFNLSNNYEDWSEKKVLAGDPNAPLSNPMATMSAEELRKLAKED